MKNFLVIPILVWLLSYTSPAAPEDFDIGPGHVDGIVRAIVLQPDSKILIGGDFSAVRGAKRERLARLYVDATVDPSFKAVQFPFTSNPFRSAAPIFAL